MQPVPLSLLQCSPRVQHWNDISGISGKCCNRQCRSVTRALPKPLAAAPGQSASPHGSNHVPKMDSMQGSSHAAHRHQHVVSRRELLVASGAAAAFLLDSPAAQAASALPTAPPPCLSRFGNFLDSPLDYSGAGPLSVVHLPRLEVVCTNCSNSCAGTNCLIRVDVCYPKGGAALGLSNPYPLAIFSPGFLVSADMYRSYAERLASWGYTVLSYDKLETVSDSLDDVTSVSGIRHLMDWAATDPLVKRVADASSVYLIGHSRGGKLSALAAAVDARVSAVCLLDPVDNTVYAPLAPGYPSAVAAFSNLCPNGDHGDTGFTTFNASNSTATTATIPGQPQTTPTTTSAAALLANCAAPNVVGGVPVAIVGSGLGGDCAPQESNYRRFFDAAPGPTWEVEIKSAGHFEFLDDLDSPTTSFQRVLCPTGSVRDAVVRDVAQTVMVAWAELMVRRRPPLLLARAARQAYPQACTGSETASSTLANGIASTAFPRGIVGHGSQGADAVASLDTSNMAVVEAMVVSGEREAPGEAVQASARMALERLVTKLRYEGQVAEVSTRYKNLG